MTYHNPLVTCSFYISPGISSYGVTSPQKAHGVFLEIEAAPSSAIPSELKSNPKPLQWPGRLHPVTLSPTPRVSRNSPFSSSCTLSPFLLELNSALFARPHPPSFPMRMHTRTADSLASSRSLLRLHLKRAMAADSLEQAEDHSVSFHGFITLFVLCCCLGPYPFVCLLALSLPRENVSLRAGTFCSVYFCVSSVWLIVGACVSRANGQAAQAQAGWNSVYVGKLMETGAITSPLLLIALPGTAQRSSEYRC